ncbi:NifU family protein [Candidatus Portiera aleyrodidarum]|uniref:Thioredoxin n=1 Tax=Candidatus Portiera aleyrodidarum MED (Bemisia tabaci) TaxID=1163752 RepID=A0AAU8RRN3_9GAMM|nr:NifU family protein [Candidatus Portiera aleyrodidarum]AFQ24104.1 thioredoxin-like protein [Candidatus Portiera aleyrodidarum BT-B-HRs]AFS18867.1 Fe/S biogenesis protein nfuA [Candidatus Portiera aleyrodidarum BT-QVLC]AJF24080.1 thioredoxin [Candidatus Portiera aleyrodidarum MED (Bemisia tabaci)]
MNKSKIIITKSAQKYLANLLYNHNMATGVRIFINKQYAEPSIEFCYKLTDKDIKINLTKINVFLEKDSLPFIKNAVIDYIIDRLGGKLTIQIPKIETNWNLEHKVNFIIDKEINPILATHGGFIRLIKVTKENLAIFQFEGGCKGCVSVDFTLKKHVKRILLERIPELTEILDLTDHTDNIKAYYKKI